MKFLKTALAALAGLALLAGASTASAQVANQGASIWPFKSFVDNGSFNTYQRGTTAISTITSTPTYHADRWALVTAGSATTASGTNITSNLPSPTGSPTFTNGEQIQRTSANTGTGLICEEQEIPTTLTTNAMSGQTVALSSWLTAGSNFSAASSSLTISMVFGSGTDEGLTKLLSGWTGAVTSSFTQPITTSWARYGISFAVPATATEAAVKFCFTPVGTAGSADFFQMTGAQLELGGAVTPFESRSIFSELPVLQSYFYQINETTAATIMPGTCEQTGGNTGICQIPTPVTMRAKPTVTWTQGTFKLNISGTQTTFQGVASTSTVQDIVVTHTAAGSGGELEYIQSEGGTGTIAASADF